MKGMKTLSMVLLAAGIMLTACNKKEPVQQVKHLKKSRLANVF